MGEVAERVGRFVTAYSSDLRDESLDGQRVVVGGIVTGVRTVITKAKATMAIVTLEDLQGTIEVVVFPRLYEQTMGDVARRRDPAGRRSGRSQERGRVAAGGPRGRLGRRGRRRRGGVRAAGRGGRAWRGRTSRVGRLRGRQRERQRRRAADGARRTGSRGARPGRRRSGVAGPAAARGAPPIPYVSPKRGGAVADVPAPPRRRCRPIAPAEPVSTYPATPGVELGPDADDEPSVPDEARSRIVADATADAPTDAGPGTVLHVRFAGSAPTDRVVGAMEAFKTVMRDRPGATRVVIHVPGPGGGEMELRRGVAYDAEMLAEVRRRLGDGMVDLRLT